MPWRWSLLTNVKLCAECSLRIRALQFLIHNLLNLKSMSLANFYHMLQHFSSIKSLGVASGFSMKTTKLVDSKKTQNCTVSVIERCNDDSVEKFRARRCVVITKHFCIWDKVEGAAADSA